MTLLMVWSEVPDATWFVIFSNISVSLYNKLVSFHGKYINSDEDTDDLNDLMYDTDGKFKFERQKFTGVIFDTKFDAVIHTGIAL